MEQLGFWNVHFVTVDLRYFAFQESIIFFFMVRFDIMTGTCGIICHEGHDCSHVYVSLQSTICVSAPIIGTVCQGIGSGQEFHNRHIQSGMLWRYSGENWSEPSTFPWIPERCILTNPAAAAYSNAEWVGSYAVSMGQGII